MKESKHGLNLPLLLLALILILGGICLLLSGQSCSGKSSNSRTDESAEYILPEELTQNETDETDNSSKNKSKVKLMDFTDLQKKNPDICAWIHIPDAGISYPVLQNPDDDTFYLKHDENKNDSASGALFTEATYNKADFTDPVTIIYGHFMHDGTFFGNLQSWFSDSSHLTKKPEVTIYTPKATWKYRVFAAVPFEKWHILYNCDFSNEHIFKTFFKQVRNVREIGAVTDSSIKVKPDDHVIILSTCLNGNRNKRFLVCAVRVKDE